MAGGRAPPLDEHLVERRPAGRLEHRRALRAAGHARRHNPDGLVDPNGKRPQKSLLRWYIGNTAGPRGRPLVHYVLRRGRRSQAVHRGVAAVKHVRPLAAGSAHPAWTARDRANVGLPPSVHARQPAARRAKRGTRHQRPRRAHAAAGAERRHPEGSPDARRGRASRPSWHARPGARPPRLPPSARAPLLAGDALQTSGRRASLTPHPDYKDCFFHNAHMRFLLV